MIHSRFHGVPLAIEPVAARRLLAAGQFEAAFGAPPEGYRDDKGYDVVGNIAVIGVQGLLMPKLGTLRPWRNYATGYDGIRANLAAALQDPEAHAIVLDVDSPGGLVSGLFDLAEVIFAARAVKPVIAICESAYSAAYAIASAAEYLTVPAAGGVGSIGVIAALTDLSGMLDKAGVAIHFVTYGRKKAAEARAQVNGVTDEVLADLQRDIDLVGEMFVSAVARNRNISADAVRDTEAACFMGQAGMALGLADRVCSPDAAFAAILADLGSA